MRGNKHTKEPCKFLDYWCDINSELWVMEASDRVGLGWGGAGQNIQALKQCLHQPEGEPALQ